MTEFRTRLKRGQASSTTENIEKSQHMISMKIMTNESASVVCSHVRLWKLDTQEEWRNTSWGLWDERTEKDTACLVYSKENKWPRTAWIDNIKSWTGLSVEESIRLTEDRDKWRKYVHGVANPWLESMRSDKAAEWRGWSIERMLRVQRVKLTGPGFSSISPERKRKARRRGQQEERVRGRVNSR